MCQICLLCAQTALPLHRQKKKRQGTAIKISIEKGSAEKNKRSERYRIKIEKLFCQNGNREALKDIKERVKNKGIGKGKRIVQRITMMSM